MYSGECTMGASDFQSRIRLWYRRYGRHTLPWRLTRDPYRVLVSEVMLQQTQAGRVIPKYREFLRAFPTLRALARAPTHRILEVWQGMGYNRRALYLKHLAGILAGERLGRIPQEPEALRKLPGIGRATAGAIAAFAFSKRVAFLETNIRRVYIHFFFRHRAAVRDAEILKKVEATLPKRFIREWYYGLMDYGALVLTKIPNPNRRSAHYHRPPRFRGSRRQVRGRILTEVVRGGGLPLAELRSRLRRDPVLKSYATPRRFQGVIRQLLRDGLIEQSRNRLIAPRTA